MLLALLVVEQGLLFQTLLHRLACDLDRVLFHFAVQHDDLQSGKSCARIAVGEDGKRFQKIVRDLHPLSAKPLGCAECAAQKPQDVLLLQRLEHEDAAARQKGAVDLERRILRRRADQDDAPLLHERQKSVLLCLVEAMNLIDEEDRPLAVGRVLLGLLHDRADLPDAARHGGKVDEPRLRLSCDDACQGRLADARRPPEDHREDLVLGDELREHLPPTHEMLLPHIVRQPFRSHACRQRQIDLASKKRILLQFRPSMSRFFPL